MWSSSLFFPTVRATSSAWIIMSSLCNWGPTRFCAKHFRVIAPSVHFISFTGVLRASSILGTRPPLSTTPPLCGQPWPLSRLSLRVAAARPSGCSALSWPCPCWLSSSRLCLFPGQYSFIGSKCFAWVNQEVSWYSLPCLPNGLNCKMHSTDFWQIRMGTLLTRYHHEKPET